MPNSRIFHDDGPYKCMGQSFCINQVTPELYHMGHVQIYPNELGWTILAEQNDALELRNLTKISTSMESVDIYKFLDQGWFGTRTVQYNKC